MDPGGGPDGLWSAFLGRLPDRAPAREPGDHTEDPPGCSGDDGAFGAADRRAC